MGGWLQQLGGIFKRQAPVSGIEPDGEAPFDPEAARRIGCPVVCVAGTRELSNLDRDSLRPESIGDDLWAVIGFAQEDDVVFADAASLRQRGFDDERLWEIARLNTAERAPIIPTAQELKDAPDMCFEPDVLTASMLAELDVWAAVAAEVADTLYVAPIADYFVLVGLAKDGEELDEIRRGARSDFASISSAADPRNCAITPELYRFRDGRWRIA